MLFLPRWKSARTGNWPFIYLEFCETSVPLPFLHGKSSFKRTLLDCSSCFWRYYTISLCKDHLMIKSMEISFHVKGDFLLIIPVPLHFSLYSYHSCHWWLHFFMWLRMKEEIWIDWISSADILIPVKFHNKVIAIGCWQPNFSFFQIYPRQLERLLALEL